MDLQSLSMRLSSLVLYRNVLEDPVLQALHEFLKTSENEEEKVRKYSIMVSRIYEKGGDLGVYLEDVLRCDDNVFVRQMARKEEPSDFMKEEMKRELELFTELSSISSDEYIEAAGMNLSLARFANTKHDFVSLISESLKKASTKGYGIYARYGMFQVDENGKIVPVLSPDKTTVDDLIGYEYERNLVINNTKALLDGKPALNALLTGDAGTGKSSTIKAVTNMFREDGLRLIEMKKEQLPLLPLVSGEIRENPLKFIIFIDDLSFAPDDDSFGALKAVLEGSASAKSDNAVIYATSNRRHMIKETFSSRDGDDIHRNDTVQEQTSLSARFGLTILYQKPNKDLYLTIVRTLAERKNIEMDPKELDVKAEAFALRKGHRSARVAEQFTDSLMI